VPVLAACLTAAGTEDQAKPLQLRRPRVTRLHEMSLANKTRFHMTDGPAHEARDAEWARLADRPPETLRCLYTFDAAEKAPDQHAQGDPGGPGLMLQVTPIRR
jgi:hypothetical protein